MQTQILQVYISRNWCKIKIKWTLEFGRNRYCCVWNLFWMRRNAQLFARNKIIKSKQIVCCNHCQPNWTIFFNCLLFHKMCMWMFCYSFFFWAADSHFLCELKTILSLTKIFSLFSSLVANKMIVEWENLTNSLE